MAKLRLISPDELAKSKGKSERQRVSEEYDEMLAGVEIGQFAEVVPDDHEKRLTVRNRLQRAAERRNVRLEFLRTRAPRLVFRLLEQDANHNSDDDEQGEALAATTASAFANIGNDGAPVRRRGRPRKNP